VDGRFFKTFARVHPTKHFPSFSLVTIGVTSALACWFNLDQIIKALVVIQIIIQFLAQVVAVTMIRRTRPDIARPFKMWLYPLPSVLAFGGWVYILIASGVVFILAGLGLLALGIGAYCWHASRKREWPFAAPLVEEVSVHS
jgi:amino acid transporter